MADSLRRLFRRLLRLPLFYKILWANVAIVALGAVAGTVITVWHVVTFPADIHFELIALFAVAGFVISFVVNNWVLKRALAPLDRLQDAVDRVRQGNLRVQVRSGPVSDERFDRLIETFNSMLATLEQDAEKMRHLSRLILQAQEDERQRVARELHDEAAQALTSLLVHLRLAERSQNPEELRQRIHELRELTAAALEDVRRVALDLRPKILDDLGLAAALEWRVEEFEKAHQVRASLHVEGVTQRLPRMLELVLYRVAQEALTNVARHAQASQVAVTLIQSDGQVLLRVADDGVGFDPAQVDEASDGLGLLGMRERLAMVGGEFLLESAPGQGTQLAARIPLDAFHLARVLFQEGSSNGPLHDAEPASSLASPGRTPQSDLVQSDPSQNEPEEIRVQDSRPAGG